MKKLLPGSRHQAGFSLIEVIITIAILMSLTIAVATMMRAGFEVKDGLSQRARVVHRMQVVLEKIAADVQHAFLTNPKDLSKYAAMRRMKTVFKIEKASSGDKLSLTTKTHRPMVAGSHESELTYVVYELQDAKDAPGRKNLYRGETKVIPEDLNEEIPKQLLARNVKGLVLEAWTGDRWSKDLWDTSRGDTRGRLPRMVRIGLEAWTTDRVDGDGQDAAEVDQGTDMIGTVVFIADSWEFQELKEPDKSIKWDAL